VICHGVSQTLLSEFWVVFGSLSFLVDLVLVDDLKIEQSYIG
jgi:hypothetical protein